MCGRYFLTKAPKSVRSSAFPEDFSETRINPLLKVDRYNIAPSQTAPILRIVDGELVGSEEKWAFCPHWMRDPRKYQINARAETVFEKPMFRAAAKSHRCLVLASGWYEWQATASGKQPWAFYLPEFEPFAFAGLWASRTGKDGETEQNFLILTTEANPTAAKVHNRMPVILSEEGCAAWLDSKVTSDTLSPYLAPYKGEVRAHPVSKTVNSPKNIGPECLERAPEAV